VSEELDAAARAFCRAVRVQATPEPRVTLSEIFKWYNLYFIIYIHIKHVSLAALLSKAYVSLTKPDPELRESALS